MVKLELASLQTFLSLTAGILMEIKRKQKVVLLSFLLTMLSFTELIMRRSLVREDLAVPSHELEAVTMESCVGVDEPSDENVR